VLGWYHTYLVETGRSAAVWALLGFVVTYAITRWITRRIRARHASEAPGDAGAIKDLYIGGVHIHHQVWGILLVLVAGLLEFRFHPQSPGKDILALLFGVGAALALDEFALWLHLEDVYWTEEGRKSIDAVMVAIVVGIAMLVGTSPVDTTGGALQDADGRDVARPGVHSVPASEITATLGCTVAVASRDGPCRDRTFDLGTMSHQRRGRAALEPWKMRVASRHFMHRSGSPPRGVTAECGKFCSQIVPTTLWAALGVQSYARGPGAIRDFSPAVDRLRPSRPSASLRTSPGIG
jgi:hypothetical protein